MTDRANIFQPLLDKFITPNPLGDGLVEDHGDGFDEEAYLKLLDEFSEHGVEDFLCFLRQIICTYPAINDFLIKCLHRANLRQNTFDT